MNIRTGLVLGLMVLLHLGNVAVAAEKEKQLYFAVAGMNLPAVEALLKEGANPNLEEQGRSLLGWAMIGGNAAIIRQLLAAGAKPDAVDKGGLTPLMLAITMQHSEAVAALLEKPQNLSLLYPGGKTVAMLAIESGKTEIVRALLDAGADFNAADPSGTTPALLAAQAMGGEATMYEIIALLGERKVDLNRSNPAFTPLFYAVEQGNAKLVDSLLTAGADHSARTKDGRLPLTAALTNAGVLQRLLAAGASPDSSNSTGEPVLFDALRDRNIEAATILLKSGAKVDRKNQSGQTPLEYAESMFMEEEVALLKEYVVSPKKEQPAQLQAEQEPTVAPKRPARNEYEALPRLRMVAEMDTTGSEVVYISGAPVREIVAFYREELAKKGWQVGQVNTDEQNYATIEAGRGKDLLTVSLALDSERRPSRVTVSLVPHGSLKVPALPRYPGSTPIFEQDAIAIYLTADAMPKVAKDTMTLLQAKGWKGKQVAQTASMRHLAFTKDGNQLTVQVSVAPAQGNKTTIQYSLQLK